MSKISKKLKYQWGGIRKYGVGFVLWRFLYRLGISKVDRSDLCVQNYYLNLPLEKREQELKEWFEYRAGYPLNIENPTTFDEKLQWLKLYDSTPLKTRLADKYEVRDWVKSKIGEEYLTPLIGVWDSFEEIDFTQFPSKFVLKGTHGCGMNIIVRDKSKFDKEQARKKFKFWMKNYDGIGPEQEWHYLNTPHRILAENYMENLSGSLNDYKVYCFNGQAKYIQLITGRGGDCREAFLNLDWSLASFTNEHYKPISDLPKTPNQLARMIELSNILSSGFPFVRVDWYLIGENDIIFGEMTFTPAQGAMHWAPREADRELGDLIILPERKFIAERNHSAEV